MLLVVEPDAVDVDLAHEVTLLPPCRPVNHCSSRHHLSEGGTPQVLSTRSDSRTAGCAAFLPENPWKRRLWKLPTSTEGSTTVRVVHLGL